MHMHRLKVSRNEGGLKVAGKEIPCMRGLIKVNDARAMRTTLRFAVPVAKLSVTFSCLSFFQARYYNTCRIENLHSLYLNNYKKKFHNVCDLK